jgi:Novel STAND NTPase 1
LRARLDDPRSLAVLVVRSEERPLALPCKSGWWRRWPPICPYRGLRPFREEDMPFFFGREAFTGRLVEVVNQQTLVAVVGASGSGKSSVVRAGLVP